MNPPSTDIILQNTGQLHEHQIQQFVAHNGLDASLSFLAHRRIAFLRFASGDASAKFYDRFAGNGRLVIAEQSVRVDYCRDEAQMDGWMCECGAKNYTRRQACYKCAKRKPTAVLRKRNNGEKDVGDVESSFVLLRNIDVDEERLFAVLSEHDPKPIRVWSVRRRTDDARRPFGFAEYATMGEADLMTQGKVQIDGVGARLSQTHAGVFVPSDTSESILIHGQRARYWDEGLYLAQYPKEVCKEPAEPAEPQSVPVDHSSILEIPPIAQPSSEEARKRKRSEPTPYMQKWQQRQHELHQEEEPESFADESRRACLLCQRKFKSAEDLQRHEELSQLHCANLANAAAVQNARGQAYRDRAGERRSFYPAPAKIIHDHKEEKKTGEGRGVSMMEKMGWAGKGLGAQSRGREQPVMAEQYRPGMGLGAEGAKVEEPGSGYASFLREGKKTMYHSFNRESQ